MGLWDENEDGSIDIYSSYLESTNSGQFKMLFPLLEEDNVDFHRFKLNMYWLADTGHYHNNGVGGTGLADELVNRNGFGWSGAEYPQSFSVNSLLNGEYEWYYWNAHGHEFYFVIAIENEAEEIQYSRRINVRQNTWSG